jgi:predicted nucleotidyltransferase
MKNNINEEDIMLTKVDVLQTLRENFPYLNSEFGVKKIGIFGSFAKGSPDESSDVDIVVEFEKSIGLRFVELSEYLEKILGRKADVLTPAGISGIRNKEIAESIGESIVYV